ncbi:MAG TPA: CoA-binding protein, partial [bacterium]|nr:CoA-binding protein [bacterium]
MPIKNKTSLDSFFNPQSVAIIGASAKPGKVGNDIVVNLKNSFGGKIYPINLDDKDIEGLPAYPSILQVPRAVDLAIIVIPAQFVPKAVEQCGKKKCTNIVIISAGFRELGPVGMKLEKQVEKIAQKYQIRILGPNCLGYISNLLPINASFAKTAP